MRKLCGLLAVAIARSAELLHNDAKNALDFAVAERAEYEAESSRRALTAAHRLNTLVACFFPIATMAAIFGANLGHGLESYDRLHAASAGTHSERTGSGTVAFRAGT